MFAQQQRNRRDFFGLAALSLAGAWIGTRDSVQFRASGGSIMNRNYSRLLSLAVLLVAQPAFNLGAAGGTAIGGRIAAAASAALPWPSFDIAHVMSLVPQPQVETDFASRHHCSFWAER
jgi:hypothetical protein